jgi:hypothetical protein
MPRLEDGAIQIIKKVTGWKWRRKDRKGTSGCFVYVPRRWEGEEVNVSLIDKPREKKLLWVHTSTQMAYVTVPCEWLDRLVKVSLKRYEEKK